MAFKTVSIAVLLVACSWAKPGGDYNSIPDYGGADVGASYQTIPDSPAYISTTDLKPASSFDISYGAPVIAEPVIPASFPIGGFGGFGGGWGWKQPIPQPIIAPIQVIAKPIQIPVGWGWSSGGIF